MGRTVEGGCCARRLCFEDCRPRKSRAWVRLRAAPQLVAFPTGFCPLKEEVGAWVCVCVCDASYGAAISSFFS